MKRKIAIVTGGVRGIGAAISQQMAKAGYRVIVCSRSKKEVNEFVRHVTKSNNKVYGLVVDISKYDNCQRLFEFASHIDGQIEVLVNNAGIYGPIGKVEDNSTREWEKTIKINLLGTLFCTQLVIPIMKKNGSGRIINLCGGGVGGKTSLPRFSAYFTSKIAIAGFTEVVADELVEDNIQVNCIAPGAVNSHFTDYLISQGPQKAGLKSYSKAIVQKRNGGDSPILAAKLVSFLASGKANHITGCLLSAKWDKIEDLMKTDSVSQNMYKLRRIDNRNFWEHA